MRRMPAGGREISRKCELLSFPGGNAFSIEDEYQDDIHHQVPAEP
jgi:hypothetical protein